MKILVITHEFPPVGGGGGHVARDICRGLTGRGHEVKVVTSDLLGGVVEEDSYDFDLIRIYTLRKNPSRASFIAMASFVLNGIKRTLLLWAWDPDLIHVHFAVPSGPIAWIISQLTSIPYVITAHLGDIPGGTPSKTDKWFKWVKPFTYPIWNNAEKVVAVSKFSRDLAQKHYQVPIQIIHNGVDTINLKFDDIRVHEPPRLVFAGRFVYQKNPILLVQVLAELKNVTWNMVMMGDGPLFQTVEKEVQKHALQERVALPGWVAPEQVQKEFLRSDVLFMTSHSEGLPIVGVQALSAGLAIVASDIGGFRDLVDQGVNGYLLNPRNKDEFADVIKGLLSNPEKLLAFKKASRMKAKHFDKRYVVNEYEKLFRGILD